MPTRRSFGRLTAITLATAVALSGCSNGSAPSDHASSEASDGAHAGMDHPMDGGPAPAGITAAQEPTYPVGTQVMITADHMDGMTGATATISGAFDTTAYAVSYTPTDGGEPVTDHRWVVQEELQDPGAAPVADGTDVVISADHMPGMEGAHGTIDSSTDETVYMVDYEADGMSITHHKWVVESEVAPLG